MNEVRLHVQSLNDFFADARDRAQSLDERGVVARSSQIAFESMEGLLKALTPNRWMLLRKLRTTGPSSIRALAQALGRDYRGVHADVSVLREAGLVERQEDGKILVPWSRITAEMSIDEAA